MARYLRSGSGLPRATLHSGKGAALKAQAYPGPLQIVVVADDYPTYTAAKTTTAEVHVANERRGKPSAINDGVAMCVHDIVVLNDANTRLSDDALAMMVRHFQDATVGAVAGAKRVTDPAGQQYYWRFEDWLKRAESARGTTIGLVGELLAIRRNLFTPMPSGVVNDDLWLALDVTERHQRIVYEPCAFTTEEASPGLAAEWERRTRVVAGTLRVLRHRPGSLIPGVGPVAGQIWGHRLLRSTAGPIAHVVLLGECVWSARRSRVARAALGVHAVVGLCLTQVARGGEVPAWARPFTQVLFLQAVGVGGVVRYLRGDHEPLWPKAERMPGNGIRS